MNFKNLARQHILEDATNRVIERLKGNISNDTFIDYNISEVRFGRFGDPVITANVLYRDNEGLQYKRISYIVIDEVIFSITSLKCFMFM